MVSKWDLMRFHLNYGHFIICTHSFFCDFSFRKFAAISNSRKEKFSSVLFGYLQIDMSSSTCNPGIVLNCDTYGKIAQNYLLELSIFMVGFIFSIIGFTHESIPIFEYIISLSYDSNILVLV